MVKYKKLKLKVCPLKPLSVKDILSKKKKDFSVKSKPVSNIIKLSCFPSHYFIKRSKPINAKINLQTDSRKCIRRWYLKNLLSYKKEVSKRKWKWRRLTFRKKLHKRFKKIFGNKRYNKKKLKLPVENANSLFYFKLTILVKKNNIFCNFSNFKDNKTLNSCSSGKYKIKVSKKTLKYTHDLVLDKFYREIWRKIYVKIKKKERKKNKKKLRKGLFVNVVCSTRLRKKVCRFVYRKFKKIPLIINSVGKKIFNGCRPPKKVRKKRRRMRIYK